VETQLKLDATSQTLPGTDTGYNPGSSAEARKPEEESLRRREQLIKDFHGKFIQLLDLAYPNVRTVISRTLTVGWVHLFATVLPLDSYYLSSIPSLHRRLQFKIRAVYETSYVQNSGQNVFE